MSWCSATEIMDIAIKAAEAAVRSVLDHDRAEVPPHVSISDVQADMDDALRPFVATIAEKLRDGDWDCIEESAYFDRFPQEMLGLDDRKWEERLRMLEEFYGGKASDG